MATHWYWERDGKEHGPVTTGQLKQMAVQSELLPSDFVWRDDSPKRVVASKVNGLFDAIPSPTAPTSTPPLPSQITIPQSVLDSSNEPAASPVPKPVEANRFAAIPTLKKSLMESAKAAGQLTAKQAERVKLTNTTLPKLYVALGKHALSTRMYQDQFPEQFKELDKVKADLAQTAIHKDAKDNTFMEKAKATAGNALQTAQAAKLSIRQSSLLANLGKVIYARHQNEGGPEQLVKPIHEALSHVAIIDSEIATLSQIGRGSWITPKRFLISTVGAACFVLWLAIGSLGQRKHDSLSYQRPKAPDISSVVAAVNKIESNTREMSEQITQSTIEKHERERQEDQRPIADNAKLQTAQRIEKQQKQAHLSKDETPPQQKKEKGEDKKEKSEAVQNSPVPVGRKLTTRVNRDIALDPSDPGGGRAGLSIKAFECYATSSTLVMDLTIDSQRWIETHLGYPLIVTLYDANGQRLTHFVTTEKFTEEQEYFDKYPQLNAYVLKEGIVNRLEYPVNVRDLWDTAIVKISFDSWDNSRSKPLKLGKYGQWRR